ncbi:hypothetical protein E0Z10_g8040 [Xylaria hypoxylon]|uniref:DUF7908 domain-containing protein n=1 Tax=Xylaria hypoxylon TaxID=37992 RepID=A0A4Z0YP24_9PEZI|nr:hypothetical protein E0Z10_g8040 [Xylaria hypoxylon]
MTRHIRYYSTTQVILETLAILEILIVLIVLIVDPGQPTTHTSAAKHITMPKDIDLANGPTKTLLSQPSLSSTVTANTGLSGVKAPMLPVIFGVSRDKHFDIDILQLSDGFIGDPLAGTTFNCSKAQVFNLGNGRLQSDDKVLGVNTGVKYTALNDLPEGGITSGFDSVAGFLVWQDPSFYNGTASYCKTANGDVYATFVESGGPAGCVTVYVTAYYAERCIDGVVVTMSEMRRIYASRYQSAAATAMASSSHNAIAAGNDYAAARPMSSPGDPTTSKNGNGGVPKQDYIVKASSDMGGGLVTAMASSISGVTGSQSRPTASMDSSRETMKLSNTGSNGMPSSPTQMASSNSAQGGTGSLSTGVTSNSKPQASLSVNGGVNIATLPILTSTGSQGMSNPASPSGSTQQSMPGAESFTTNALLSSVSGTATRSPTSSGASLPNGALVAPGSYITTNPVQSVVPSSMVSSIVMNSVQSVMQSNTGSSMSTPQTAASPSASSQWLSSSPSLPLSMNSVATLILSSSITVQTPSLSSGGASSNVAMTMSGASSSSQAPPASSSLWSQSLVSSSTATFISGSSSTRLAATSSRHPRPTNNIDGDDGEAFAEGGIPGSHMTSAGNSGITTAIALGTVGSLVLSNTSMASASNTASNTVSMASTGISSGASSGSVTSSLALASSHPSVVPNTEIFNTLITSNAESAASSTISKASTSIPSSASTGRPASGIIPVSSQSPAASTTALLNTPMISNSVRIIGPFYEFIGSVSYVIIGSCDIAIDHVTDYHVNASVHAHGSHFIFVYLIIYDTEYQFFYGTEHCIRRHNLSSPISIYDIISRSTDYFIKATNYFIKATDYFIKTTDYFIKATDNTVGRNFAIAYSPSRFNASHRPPQSDHVNYPKPTKLHHSDTQ